MSYIYIYQYSHTLYRHIYIYINTIYILCIIIYIYIYIHVTYLITNTSWFDRPLPPPPSAAARSSHRTRTRLQSSSRRRGRSWTCRGLPELRGWTKTIWGRFWGRFYLKKWVEATYIWIYEIVMNHDIRTIKNDQECGFNHQKTHNMRQKTWISSSNKVILTSWDVTSMGDPGDMKYRRHLMLSPLESNLTC